MRLIFSRGRDTWHRTESRVMPRNSSDVQGPAFFFCGKGDAESLEQRGQGVEAVCRGGGRWCDGKEVVQAVDDV